MPRPQNESTKISLMNRLERDIYEHKKAAKQKKEQYYRNLLASFIVTPEIHDLIVQLALHLGVNKPEAVRLACLHRLHCWNKVEVEVDDDAETAPATTKHRSRRNVRF